MPDLPGQSDFVVVGGGIIGLATGLALQARGVRSAVVIEAEPGLAAHQTGRNSGVIHSGIYYAPGSLKARLCVQGREALYQFCTEEGVPATRSGKLIVATSPAEVDRLHRLEERGQENGLTGLQWLDGGAIRDHEPHVWGLSALRIPQTGVVEFADVTTAMARRFTAAGGRVCTGTALTAVDATATGVRLTTSAGSVTAGMLVNCAGLQSDRVAALCGLRPEVRIIPFRGEYYRLAPSRGHLVRGLIYPVPDPRLPFLGVHFTRRQTGVVELGPNAVPALSRTAYGRGQINWRDATDTLLSRRAWALAGRHFAAGIGELYRSLSKRAFLRALRRYMPELQLSDLQSGNVGIRAQAVAADGSLVDDFRITRGLASCHVLNAPSPAATASLAIGAVVADEACR